MEQVLLLNITYEPLKIINWKRAITLLLLDKVEVVEEYTRDIHSVSFTIKLPSVVRLLRLVKKPKTPVKFSRQNIYARDKYSCQYCGGRSPRPVVRRWISVAGHRAPGAACGLPHGVAGGRPHRRA